MADIFDEVNQDLRADQARQLAQRYGGLLALACVLLVAAVAGWQVWHWYQMRRANEAATVFLSAMQAADSTAPAAGQPTAERNKAAEEFARLATTAPEGYRTLARLRDAGLQADAGDTKAASALWDQVSADTSADPVLRDLANLLWVRHNLDAGDPAVLEGRLRTLTSPGNAWRPLAQETDALLMIRTGKNAEARRVLTQLAADPAAPGGVRARANGMLLRLDEAPPAPAASSPAAAEQGPAAAEQGK